MKVVRAAAFGAVVVTALTTWITPASADTPTGRWTDPAPATQYQGAPLAYLQKAQQLRGQADFGAGSIASVSFTLVQDAANTPSTDPCSASNAVKPQSVAGGSSHVDFAFDAPFPCNRKYEVRATVTPAKRTLQNDSPALLNLWVAVAIPPAPTTGLTASPLSGDDRGVKLTWAGVTREPDFVGFEIRRAIGDAAFEPVADAVPGATSWTDHKVPRNGGTLRYQVVGMRPGPEAGTTVFAPVGSTATATVDPAPTTTVPATGGSGGSGGSDGSGATSGGPSGAGVPTGAASPSVHREFSVPGATSLTPTTVDDGFSERLPFKQRSGVATGEGSSVANLSDGGGKGDGRQQALLVGGATVTFSWAMLFRFLNRRALGL